MKLTTTTSYKNGREAVINYRLFYFFDITKMLEIIVTILCFSSVYSTFILPVDKEILVKLCKNNFTVPVASRTNTEKVAVINFWRVKEKFSIEGNKLYYDEKKVRK